MEYLWWILIFIFFIGGFVGIVYSFIPHVFCLWSGFLLYQFMIAEQGLPVSFWWGMVIFTILLIGADFATTAFFVKKYGGSNWGIIGSMVGILVGPIFLGPLGLLVGPLVFVFVLEWGRGRNIADACKISLGSLGAFLSSMVVKCFLQIAMLIWFFIVA